MNWPVVLGYGGAILISIAFWACVVMWLGGLI